MLGLDPALALVTIAAMATAPISMPLLVAFFGGVSIDPLALAWGLALLIGSAEGIALLLRHHAAALLVRHHTGVDAMVLVGLLVFALSTMAGIQARLLEHVRQRLMQQSRRAIVAVSVRPSPVPGRQRSLYAVGSGYVFMPCST